MESLSGSIQVGDIVYHPVVDFGSCGFLIEKIEVKKLVGPSGNPMGKPEVIWFYGNISSYKKGIARLEEWHKIYQKIYSVNQVFSTIEECIPKLEKFKNQFMNELQLKKELSVSEIEELKKLIKELQSSSKEEIKISNKRMSMLKSLNVLENLKNKNMIE